MIKKPTYAGIGKIWISLLLLSIAIGAYRYYQGRKKE